jgi:hypothetical protein
MIGVIIAALFGLVITILGFNFLTWQFWLLIVLFFAYATARRYE